MEQRYVQYGCGITAPKEWINFDVSPTLRIQKLPLIGKRIAKKIAGFSFPDNVRYGDITKGLPIPENTCDGLYSSHTLEHLPLDGFRMALINSYKILKPGGIFRCIVPDLEPAARQYITSLDGKEKETASITFMGPHTLLGAESRPKGLKGLLRTFFGNANHLWMWDHKSMEHELKLAGFKNIRKCGFDDCQDLKFKHVEDPRRFISAVAFECTK